MLRAMDAANCKNRRRLVRTLHVAVIACTVAVPGNAANLKIVAIDARSLVAAVPAVVMTDSHMEVLDGQGAHVRDQAVFESGDSHLIVDASRYERITLRLHDWPVDEWMYLRRGRVEISDERGHRRIFGPGDSFVMPKGFGGIWRQLAPIEKIALSYDGGLAADANRPIVDLSASDLRGSQARMQRIERSTPSLQVVDGLGQGYVEIPRFQSSDGKLTMHVKRFERMTLELRHWPVEELVHVLRGHLELIDATGAVQSVDPGDTFVVPHGFTGTWRQKDTIEMITVAYASAVDAQLHPSDAGRAFYYDTVLPLLAQNGCPSCHAVGYMHPNVTVYEELLRRLAIGDSPTHNAVIYKIANVRSIAPDRPEHPGGQRCASIDAEPCASIRRWWSIEFGGESPSPIEASP